MSIFPPDCEPGGCFCLSLYPQDLAWGLEEVREAMGSNGEGFEMEKGGTNVMVFGAYLKKQVVEAGADP